MIKNVVFDIGMVLVSFPWKEYLVKQGITGKAYEVMCDVIFNNVWPTMDGTSWGKEETINECLKLAPEYREYIEKVFDNVYDISDPFEYSDQWIEEVSKTHKVYLLSNFGKYPFEVLSRKYGFVDKVDGKVISYEVECCKPNEYIYNCLFEKYNLVPSECVFIDDREENIKMAQKLGMRGILFKNYEEARKELELILNDR